MIRRYLTFVLLIVLMAPVSTGAQRVRPPGSSQDPVPPEVIAKNLAENVLGEGTVKRVQVHRGGQLIIIAWETVLYKTTNTVQHNREQMSGEAQLATGSIMGVMRPERIEFTMLNGQKTLASGYRTRAGDFSITYAKDLGG